MDARTFIAAMRNVPTPVSIVATDGGSGSHGATVSAFCSLSADPPSLLVCLNRHSRISRIVEDNGAFALNILGEAHDGLAQAFAGDLTRQDIRNFDPPDWATGALGQPHLLASASAFFCEVDQSMNFGTHTIVIGLVREVAGNPASGIVYLDGSYGDVAKRG